MILEIIIGILFFAIFVGLLIYVSWRLKYLFSISKKRNVFIPVISLTIGSIIVYILLNLTSNMLYYILYRIMSIWIGIFLYLICYLALFELAYGFFKLFRNRRAPEKIRIPHQVSVPKRTIGIIIVILTLLTSSYGIWNAYDVDIKYVDLEMNGLNETVKIAVLADVHVGSSGGKGHLEKLVKMTNELEPDIVLLPGDLTDSRAFLTEDIFSPFKDLTAPAFFVNGNHEMYTGEDELNDLLNSSGIRVLENEVVNVHGVQLVGLRYMSEDGSNAEMHSAEENMTIKKFMPTLNLSDDKPAVLMHHSPVGISYAQEAGVDLFIAGHTHGGGQMFPFTILGGPMAYEHYKGLSSHKDMKVYVSEGVGFWFVPMRVGTDSEITLITLQSGVNN